MQNSCMCSRESCVLHFVAASTKGAKGMDIIIICGGMGCFTAYWDKGKFASSCVTLPFLSGARVPRRVPRRVPWGSFQEFQ